MAVYFFEPLRVKYKPLSDINIIGALQEKCVVGGNWSTFVLTHTTYLFSYTWVGRQKWEHKSSFF